MEPRDKAGRKGRGGEGEKEKHSPEDVSSSFYTTLQTAQDFSAFTTECSGKKNENLPCHTKEQANNCFFCQNTNNNNIFFLFLWCLVISASVLLYF